MLDVIKARKKFSPWGIEGYQPASFNAHFDKPRVAKIAKSKKECFIDEAIKLKSFVPDAKYDVDTSFSK